MLSVKENLDLLGFVAQDKVTGCEGVVTSISFDLYGCIQAVLSPKADKDGKRPDSAWFDVCRLVKKEGPVMEAPDFDIGIDKGPETKPIPRQSKIENRK